MIGKQVSKNLADADVQLNGELILNGNQVRPGVKVTFKGKTLTEGVDYIVTYGPTNEVGNNKGTVTVTGIGDYSGTKTLTFNIYAKPVYVIIEKTDGVSVTQASAWTCQVSAKHLNSQSHQTQTGKGR